MRLGLKIDGFQEYFEPVTEALVESIRQRVEKRILGKRPGGKRITDVIRKSLESVKKGEKVKFANMDLEVVVNDPMNASMKLLNYGTKEYEDLYVIDTENVETTPKRRKKSNTVTNESDAQPPKNSNTSHAQPIPPSESLPTTSNSAAKNTKKQTGQTDKGKQAGKGNAKIITSAPGTAQNDGKSLHPQVQYQINVSNDVVCSKLDDLEKKMDSIINQNNDAVCSKLNDLGQKMDSIINQNTEILSVLLNTSANNQIDDELKKIRESIKANEELIELNISDTTLPVSTSAPSTTTTSTSATITSSSFLNIPTIPTTETSPNTSHFSDTTMATDTNSTYSAAGSSYNSLMDNNYYPSIQNTPSRSANQQNLYYAQQYQGEYPNQSFSYNSMYSTQQESRQNLPLDDPMHQKWWTAARNFSAEKRHSFAWNICQKLIPWPELEGRNCSGKSSLTGGSRGLIDPAKLLVIEKIVFHYFPVAAFENYTEKWKACMININSNIRTKEGTLKTRANKENTPTTSS